MSKKKNNTHKKSVKPTTRILMGVGGITVVIAAVTAVMIHYKHADEHKAHIYADSAPSVTTLPGIGSPTKVYSDAQKKLNEEGYKKARATYKSNVPTLIRSDFDGNISSFISTQKEVKATACPVKLGSDFKRDPANCTVENLRLARKAGVSAAELICQSCPIASLKKAGYTIGELKSGGHSASELRKAGYTLSDLMKAGYSPAELKKAGYSADALRAMGLTPEQLAAAGCSLSELKSAGLSADVAKKALKAVDSAEKKLAEARDAGISLAGLLKDGASLAALKKAGYSARELLAAGSSLDQLKKAGWGAKELAEAGFSGLELTHAGYTPAEIAKIKPIIARCQLRALKKAHAKGVPIKQLLITCHAEALRAAGYTLNELVKGGVDPKALRQAGYTVPQLKKAGYDVKSLLDAGYGASALQRSGVGLSDLLAGGASLSDLVKSGVTKKDFSGAGIRPKQLLDGGASVEALKKLGYTTTALSAAGVGAGALKSAGFSAADLNKAGFSAGQLRQAGYSAKELKQVGYPLKALKLAGYTSGDLLRAGFGADDLFSPKQSKVSVVPTQKRQPAVAKNSINLPSFGGGRVRSHDAVYNAARDKQLTQMKALQKLQQEQLNKSERANMLSNIKSKIASQSRSLMSGWGNISSQQVTNVAPSRSFMQRLTGRGSDSDATSSASSSGKNANTPPTFKAGTIMYAVLQTSVNSDESTPIMATIISGELKGAKMMGSFKMVGTKLSLNFNSLNIPSFTHTISFQGVAIDPSTSRTALSGDVNHHYWKKYGTLFLSSFLQGVGSAFTGSSSTCQLVSSTGTVDPFCQTITKKLNLTGSLVGGLGEVGNRFSDKMGNQFDALKPTVKIPGGTAFGLLIMQDLTLSQPLPKKNPLTTLNDLRGDTNER